MGPHHGKPGAKNPHDYYPFSTGGVFEGVISGDGQWKLHIPHEYARLVERARTACRASTGRPAIELSLFDMEKDPNETTNVIEKYPEVAARLKGYAEQHRKEFFN